MGDKAEILRIRLEDYLSGFNGLKVFFREKHAVEDDFFINDKTHSIVNTEDFHIIESLRKYSSWPLPTSIIFDKTRYSAFYNTGLDVFLKKEHVGKVIMAGIETHTSILFTAEELRNRGYEVTVIEPCTMSRDNFLADYAISLMKNCLSVGITNG
jgi:nicotinamidase-related amidase